MNRTGGNLQLLHLHSTFEPGGKELRCVRLINAFGLQVGHSIVSAQHGVLGAAKFISRGVRVSYPMGFPSLTGWPTLGRLQRIAKAMRAYDLILTYNWGAMDAVMAHTLFARTFKLPPLIHHEDGFNDDEAGRLKSSRNWYRRIALGYASALIVPSRRLETIALDIWHQPKERVHRIANGIPVASFSRKPRADAIRGVIKRDGEMWVGTLAGLRPVKNLPRLVRVFANLPDHWQLVILGEGHEREKIREEAIATGLAHRVHMPGHIADPAKAIGLFDIFALSSDSEQFPLSVVEAMAAGLPVAAPDIGDIADIVAEENHPFITPSGDETAQARAIADLAADKAMRKSVGAANRMRAKKNFNEGGMIEAYKSVYAAALGRDRFP